MTDLEQPASEPDSENLISDSEQPHTYPPPSCSILPIRVSHSDVGPGVSSAQDSTREHPSLHGTQKKEGLWNVANETQRAMQSRHLIMIGMSFKIIPFGRQCGLKHPSPSYRWYHWYRNILECRSRASIELTPNCCMKLTPFMIASRPYRQAVLQVHFSLMLFLAYSSTLWRLPCKLIFLWLLYSVYFPLIDT